MSTTTEKAKRPNASENLFREDYRRHTAITIAEAADYAGVKIQTIRNWLCTGRIAYANRFGPFKVDSTLLMKHLTTGEWTGKTSGLKKAKRK